MYAESLETFCRLLKSIIMQSYAIPNTDGASYLTKKLKFNYQKYRALLHFIFLNKDYFELTEKKVCAVDSYVAKECGKTVFKTVNLSFNPDNWLKLWDEISEDDIFLYHVKEIYATPDIQDFLNGTIPCGMTRRLHNVVQFGESLKRCLKTLAKKTKYPPAHLQIDREILETWMHSLEINGAENFTIPSEIYGLAQRYSSEESPDFASDLEEIIRNAKGHGVLKPYIWATIIEEVYDAEISLPVYEVHPAFDNAILDKRSPNDNHNESTEDPLVKRRGRPRRVSKQKDSLEYDLRLSDCTTDPATTDDNVITTASAAVAVSTLVSFTDDTVAEQKVTNAKEEPSEADLDAYDSNAETETLKEPKRLYMSLRDIRKPTWKELENQVKKEEKKIDTDFTGDVEDDLMNNRTEESVERKIKINLPEGVNFNVNRQPKVVLTREEPSLMKKHVQEKPKEKEKAVEEEESEEENEAENGEEEEEEKEEEKEEEDTSKEGMELCNNPPAMNMTPAYQPSIIPFPLIPGMKIEGLKFKVFIKSLSFEPVVEDVAHHNSSSSSTTPKRKNSTVRQRSNSVMKKASKKHKSSGD